MTMKDDAKPMFLLETWASWKLPAGCILYNSRVCDAISLHDLQSMLCRILTQIIIRI